MLFNAGCNEQVFLLNPNLAQTCPVVFEKNAPLIPKYNVTEPKSKLLARNIVLIGIGTLDRKMTSFRKHNCALELELGLG